jgi:beta-barrel assembly-enhancing protease
MSIQQLAVLTVLACALPSPGSTADASSPPQTHRSKSDANINAIGHRRIDHGPNFYSSEKEKEIGKKLSEETERSSKLLNDPAVIEYIERVAQNLAKNSDARFPITVTVVDSDAVEAFTLPGGYQFVSRGLLLQLTDEAELASVLARGIAHTALRSATALATEAGITTMAVTPVTPVTTSSSAPDAAASQVALMQLALMRRDEMDADYFGVQYMYKAGYDPKGFIDFVQRNGSAGSTADENVIVLFNSFPPVHVRLAALRNEISRILPPQADAIISTPGFAEFRDRLRPQGPEPLK